MTEVSYIASLFGKASLGNYNPGILEFRSPKCKSRISILILFKAACSRSMCMKSEVFFHEKKKIPKREQGSKSSKCTRRWNSILEVGEDILPFFFLSDNYNSNNSLFLLEVETVKLQTPAHSGSLACRNSSGDTAVILGDNIILKRLFKKWQRAEMTPVLEIRIMPQQ